MKGEVDVPSSVGSVSTPLRRTTAAAIYSLRSETERHELMTRQHIIPPAITHAVQQPNRDAAVHTCNANAAMHITL